MLKEKDRSSDSASGPRSSSSNERDLLVWRRKLDDLKGKSGRLCFVGASHSGILTQFSRMSMNSLGIQSINVRHLDYRFAANLTHSAMLDAKENCDKVVIGMGQWDASSRNEGGPTPFQEYKKILLKAVQVFVKPLLDGGIVVYFRNMQ